LFDKLNNHPLKKAGGLEKLATKSRDTGRIALFGAQCFCLQCLVRKQAKETMKVFQNQAKTPILKTNNQ